MTGPQPSDDDILQVSIDFSATRMYIRLKGEMDVSTADHFRSAVPCPGNDCPHETVVDLSDLTFCDASGLNALLAVHEQLASTDHLVRVEGVRPNIHRILRITGIDQVLIPEQRNGHELFPEHA